MKVSQQIKYSFSVKDVMEVFEKHLKETGFMIPSDTIEMSGKVKSVPIPGYDIHDCDYRREVFDGLEITITKKIEK